MESSASGQSWPHSNKPAAATNSTRKFKASAHRHLTDEILTPFHLPFPTSAIRSHLSLTSFAVFLWNWGTFFYTQTGRLDLNATRPRRKMPRCAFVVETYQGDWSVSWTQVISTCCLELISALELLVTHGLSASGVIFHLSFVPLFAARHDIFQTGFNKTFCICHRKGATKPGKLLTLFLWQASKALQNMTGTTAWRASEESSLYLRLCTVYAIHRFSCLHFLASATSLGFSLFYLHHIFSFLLSFFWEPSVVLSPSPSLVWNEHCIPDVYAATTTKQTLLFALHRDISLTWSWFGSNRPDWWPIKSTSHTRSEK